MFFIGQKVTKKHPNGWHMDPTIPGPCHDPDGPPFGVVVTVKEFSLAGGREWIGIEGWRDWYQADAFRPVTDITALKEIAERESVFDVKKVRAK
jgi:hypothetical protein